MRAANDRAQAYRVFWYGLPTREDLILKSQPPLDTEDQRPLRAWILGSMATVTAVLAITFGPMLARYRLRGDDFSLVWHSAAPYVDGAQARSWFTEGYTEYFWNYPAWDSIGFDLSRPAVNMAFWIQSHMASAMGDRAYTLLPIALPVVTTGLLVTVLARGRAMPLTTAAALAVAVGISPVWHESFYYASFVTTSLALGLSVLGISLVLRDSGPAPPPTRIAAGVLAVVVAVAAHETAIVMAVVSAALVFRENPSRQRFAALTMLCVPMLYLGASRLLLPDGSGVYLINSMDPAAWLTRLKHVAISPVMPVEQVRFLASRASMTPAAQVPYLLAIAGNWALIAVVATGFLRQRPLAAMASAAAWCAALVPAIVTEADPRFMGYSAVAAVLVARHVRPGHAKALQLTAILLLVSQLLLVSAVAAERVEREAVDMAAAGDFFDLLRQDIEAERPDHVFLVNDTVGVGGSLSMMHLAAWPETRARLTVVNQYDGPPDPTAELFADVRGGALSLRNRLGRGQRLWFSECLPDFTLAHDGLTYSDVVFGEAPGVHGFMATTEAPRGKAMIVGIDPATGHPMQRRVFENSDPSIAPAN